MRDYPADSARSPTALRGPGPRDAELVACLDGVRAVAAGARASPSAAMSPAAGACRWPAQRASCCACAAACVPPPRRA
eukprot:5146970-Alexandrium_andersonii.AAC.1